VTDACYIQSKMRSVADRLRAEDRAALRALTPEARVALALALGARDLDSFRLAHRPTLEPSEAARILDRRRQERRRPSHAIAELIG